jgi:hypothetical protein
MKPTLVSVKFRLRASSLNFWVDVRLRSFGGRWVAVAVMAGDRELGLGATARAARTPALSALGPSTAAELLADPQLLDVSRMVR